MRDPHGAGRAQELVLHAAARGRVGPDHHRVARRERRPGDVDAALGQRARAPPRGRPPRSRCARSRRRRPPAAAAPGPRRRAPRSARCWRRRRGSSGPGSRRFGSCAPSSRPSARSSAAGSAKSADDDADVIDALQLHAPSSRPRRPCRSRAPARRRAPPAASAAHRRACRRRRRGSPARTASRKPAIERCIGSPYSAASVAPRRAARDAEPVRAELERDAWRRWRGCRSRTARAGRRATTPLCTQPRAPFAKWKTSVIASSMLPRGPSAWASRTEPAVVCDGGDVAGDRALQVDVVAAALEQLAAALGPVDEPGPAAHRAEVAARRASPPAVPRAPGGHRRAARSRATGSRRRRPRPAAGGGRDDRLGVGHACARSASRGRRGRRPRAPRRAGARWCSGGVHTHTTSSSSRSNISSQPRVGAARRAARRSPRRRSRSTSQAATSSTPSAASIAGTWTRRDPAAADDPGPQRHQPRPAARSSSTLPNLPGART